MTCAGSSVTLSLRRRPMRASLEVADRRRRPCSPSPPTDAITARASLRRAPHLGLGDDAPSAHPHDRAGSRHAAGPCLVQTVPPPVLDAAAFGAAQVKVVVNIRASDCADAFAHPTNSHFSEIREFQTDSNINLYPLEWTEVGRIVSIRSIVVVAVAAPIIVRRICRAASEYDRQNKQKKRRWRPQLHVRFSPGG